ncbi:MAG: hypothetical protein RL721_1630 [Candidatus Eisenbacteria bacterium]
MSTLAATSRARAASRPTASRSGTGPRGRRSAEGFTALRSHSPRTPQATFTWGVGSRVRTAWSRRAPRSGMAATSSVAPYVAALALDGVSGRLHAGGAFASAGGTPSSNIAVMGALFPILASGDAHGSIEPSGCVMLARDGSATFRVVPAPGYRVEDVIVDGVSVGQRFLHRFASVREPHTLSATFTALALPLVKARSCSRPRGRTRSVRARRCGSRRPGPGTWTCVCTRWTAGPCAPCRSASSTRVSIGWSGTVETTRAARCAKGSTSCVWSPRRSRERGWWSCFGSPPWAARVPSARVRRALCRAVPAARVIGRASW